MVTGRPSGPVMSRLISGGETGNGFGVDFDEEIAAADTLQQSGGRLGQDILNFSTRGIGKHLQADANEFLIDVLLELCEFAGWNRGGPGSSPVSIPRMALSMSLRRSTSLTYWRSTCP
jgi:hypothetical protein